MSLEYDKLTEKNVISVIKLIYWKIKTIHVNSKIHSKIIEAHVEKKIRKLRTSPAPLLSYLQCIREWIYPQNNFKINNQTDVANTLSTASMY